MITKHRFLGATLLISGTSIGAGIFALPIVTAMYGFWPALLIFTVAWLLMTLAALMMLEVCCWLPEGANIVSMAAETLGKSGKIIAWIAYLFLLYCLLAAYLAGLQGIISDIIQSWFNIHLPLWGLAVILIGLFGTILFLGTGPMDLLNRLLIIGLTLSFFTLMGLSVQHVDTAHFDNYSFSQSWLTLPVIITAFGYQIIIPTLRHYLHDDRPTLIKAIWIGSAIPLITYIIWEYVILGVVPTSGEHGLVAISSNGNTTVALSSALEQALNNQAITSISKSLVFYAIATSFIGVSLSLFDFLADGFHVIKKTHRGRLFIACAAFIPPLLFADLYPRAYLAALSYAGIFVALLLILLPATMIFRGRYIKKESLDYRAPGGIITLGILTIFALAVIGIALL